MTRGKPAILAFIARINGVDYPAALFKMLRRGVHGWIWQFSGGHLIFLDPRSVLNNKLRLSEGLIFQNVDDHHFSYPFDGRYHQTIKASGREGARLPRHRAVAFPEIQCESFRSIDVPLTDPFRPLETAAWRDVLDPTILSSEGFEGAHSVTLHCFICRKDRVRDLFRRWRTAARFWTAGNQNIRLVVLAEPLPLRVRTRKRSGKPARG